LTLFYSDSGGGLSKAQNHPGQKHICKMDEVKNPHRKDKATCERRYVYL